jgi:hypothetical protein
MKNKFINERHLESLVKKVIREEKLSNINEALPRRERERHQTNWRKREFEPYDREKDIMSAFGSYSGDIPPNVISYLRKNPRRFLQRIVDIYGMDKVLEFIGYQQPEMVEGYDSYMSDFVNKTYSEYKEGKISKEELKSLIPHLEKQEKEELLNLLKNK